MIVAVSRQSVTNPRASSGAPERCRKPEEPIRRGGWAAPQYFGQALANEANGPYHSMIKLLSATY